MIVQIDAFVELLDFEVGLSSSARNVRGFGDSGTWIVRGTSSFSVDSTSDLFLNSWYHASNHDLIELRASRSSRRKSPPAPGPHARADHLAVKPQLLEADSSSDFIETDVSPTRLASLTRAKEMPNWRWGRRSPGTRLSSLLAASRQVSRSSGTRAAPPSYGFIMQISRSFLPPESFEDLHDLVVVSGSFFGPSRILFRDVVDE